jgi:hypothetical protein
MKRIGRSHMPFSYLAPICPHQQLAKVALFTYFYQFLLKHGGNQEKWKCHGDATMQCLFYLKMPAFHLIGISRLSAVKKTGGKRNGRKAATTGATCNNHPAYKSKTPRAYFRGTPRTFLCLATLFAARSSLIASMLCYVISFLERRRVQLVVFPFIACSLTGRAITLSTDPTLQIHCRSPSPCLVFVDILALVVYPPPGPSLFNATARVIVCLYAISPIVAWRKNYRLLQVVLSSAINRYFIQQLLRSR